MGRFDGKVRNIATQSELSRKPFPVLFLLLRFISSDSAVQKIFLTRHRFMKITAHRFQKKFPHFPTISNSLITNFEVSSRHSICKTFLNLPRQISAKLAD